MDAGLPRGLCNRPVFDRSGRHLGTPDLVDPVAGVVGEYDGALHFTGRQRATDLRREADYRSVGLEYVTMVGADRHDPSAFVRRLHAAYARAPRTPESVRAWTLEPPPWWVSTATVAARRRLDERQRTGFLRYRRAG